MRIVASQIRLNEASPDDQSFRIVRPARSQQSDSKFLQLRFRQNRHSLSPWVHDQLNVDVTAHANSAVGRA
jgi:hypothetical protein